MLENDDIPFVFVGYYDFGKRQLNKMAGVRYISQDSRSNLW